MNKKQDSKVATIEKEETNNLTCSDFKIYHQSTFKRWDIEDESIQAIITSPPYFRKRFYNIPSTVIGGNPNCEHEFETGKGKWTIQIGNPNFNKNGTFCNKCGAWKGQYGWEPNPELFITHTRIWLQEAKRVLRNDGVLFLNLGDSYLEKRQLLIPEQIGVALNKAGWILRNRITWYKNNAQPHPVKDRFSNKGEVVFMFSKNKKYYFNLDSVREPHKTDGTNWKRHQLGKNPGDIWMLNTQRKKLKHSAMFPEKLAERMILCSTKQGDIVLDAFAGSGTVIFVAHRLGRKAFGIDLGYQDVQERRLSDFLKAA